MEEWRDIEGYEGLYQVSNEGRVRSLDKEITYTGRWGKCSRPFKGAIVEPYEMNKNYLMVNLWKDGKYVHYLVHQLVAEAFIQNPNGYTVVHHKNHNKQDNKLVNLVWVCDEAHRGMHAKENFSKRVDQIDPITGEVLKTWGSTADVERELGYKHSAISLCCNGKHNTAYGFIWRYHIG